MLGPMRVLVTGGAGYIGSVVVEELLLAGHEVTAYDDMSRGHRDVVVTPARLVEANLLDGDALGHALGTHRIEGVVHMAAESLVGESVTMPARYYRTNVVGSLGLVDAMLHHGVRWIVFSSSAAVYGAPARQPIEESAPAAPTNPYGETKLAFERALGWYGAAYGIRSVALRYFNAAGATERNGERHDPETHLIPLALAAAAGLRDAVTVLGDDYPTPDGTCIRDYVHVSDLARAHVLALEALAAGRCEGTFNLGCGGTGSSVREVIEAARKVTGREIPVRMGSRRPGDPPRLVAATDHARRTFGWSPRVTRLDDIIESAWRWQRSRARRT